MRFVAYLQAKSSHTIRLIVRADGIVDVVII